MLIELANIAKNEIKNPIKKKCFTSLIVYLFSSNNSKQQKNKQDASELYSRLILRESNIDNKKNSYQKSKMRLISAKDNINCQIEVIPLP